MKRHELYATEGRDAWCNRCHGCDHSNDDCLAAISWRPVGELEVGDLVLVEGGTAGYGARGRVHSISLAADHGRPGVLRVALETVAGWSTVTARDTFLVAVITGRLEEVAAQ